MTSYSYEVQKSARKTRYEFTSNENCGRVQMIIARQNVRQSRIEGTWNFPISFERVIFEMRSVTICRVT